MPCLSAEVVFALQPVKIVSMNMLEPDAPPPAREDALMLDGQSIARLDLGRISKPEFFFSFLLRHQPRREPVVRPAASDGDVPLSVGGRDWPHFRSRVPLNDLEPAKDRSHRRTQLLGQGKRSADRHRAGCRPRQ